MPDYKVSGTATPNAQIVAYPNTDDIIYGTANAVGAYEIQWTAAAAQQTRVIAKNGVELKIDIVTPVEVV